MYAHSLLSLLVGLLFAGAVGGVRASPAARAELDCTSLANGVYPNVADCSTFFKCSNGHTYLYDCPSNLLFDKIDLRCEWPQLARCADDECSKHTGGEFHGVIGCHGHAYGDLYPDPYDCHYFYHCAHGAGGTIEAHHKECPANLHFNDELKVCDWPENAGCKACGPDPTQPPTEAPTTARPTRPPSTRPTRPTTARPTRPTRPPPTTQAPTDPPTTTQAPTTTSRPKPTWPPFPTLPPWPTLPPKPTWPPLPTWPTLPPKPTWPTWPPLPTWPTWPPRPTKNAARV